MATTAQSNKIVENYTLDSIRYVNPDQSEVWTARHKVLKKIYMLKKCKLAKGAGRDNEKVGCDNEANAAGMQNIIRQVELLKALKIQGAPKYQKMIKTASNIFIVYDQFAGVPLAEFAKTHLKAFQSKLETMLRLSRKLLSFHNQGLVFLQLSPQNIFLQNNQQVFFSQWSLCIFKNNSKGVFPVNNPKKSEFIASQVTEESRFSTASDVYSLGKIFSYIALCNKKSGKQDEVPKEVSEIIEKMSDKKAKNRPALQAVIDLLEKTRDYIRVENRKDVASTEASNETQNEQARSNCFTNQTPSIQERSEPSLMKAQKINTPSRTISFDNILTGMRRASSQTSVSPNKCVSPTKNIVNAVSRKISKTRNLSYFILNLSEFAMKQPNGEYLSFLLLKQAYQILNSCYLELKNQGLKDAKSLTVLQILKKETVQMNLSVNLMKEYFNSQATEPEFKAELRNDLNINERYYKEQIIFFSNEFMKQTNNTIRQNKVSSLNNLVNDLFSLYMILKRVEEGSFEKYWDKIYSTQYAFLRSQRYFVEEKKLGYRYLKSKIAQILNKK